MTRSPCLLLALIPLLGAAAELSPTPSPTPAPAPQATAPTRVQEAALVGDVRLLLASAPGLSTVRGLTIDDDGGGGLLIAPEILLRHRVAGRFGYLIGVGLFASAHSITDDLTDGNFTYYAGGVQASAGLTLRIKTAWHAELRALGQIGRGALVFTPEDNDDDDSRGEVGSYRAFGGLAGLAYTLANGLELAGHAGWQDVDGRSDFAGSSTTAEGRGLVTGISLGYVF